MLGNVEAVLLIELKALYCVQRPRRGAPPAALAFHPPCDTSPPIMASCAGPSSTQHHSLSPQSPSVYISPTRRPAKTRRQAMTDGLSA